MYALALDRYNPWVMLVYFAGIIVCTMLFMQPVLSACLLAGGVVLYVSLKGKRACSFLLYVLATLVFVALINPVFNTLGNTVLFCWWWGRPYTLEALIYGSVLGCTIAAVLVWFACANEVLISHKTRYMLGICAPQIALVVMFSLRNIQLFTQRAHKLVQARKGLALYGCSSRYGDTLRDAQAVLHALVAHMFERSIDAANSMRARGFGLKGKRKTSFVAYSFRTHDGVFLTLALALCGFLAGALYASGVHVQYYPSFKWSVSNPDAFVVCVCALMLLMIIPTALVLRERLLWRFSILTT